MSEMTRQNVYVQENFAKFFFRQKKNKKNLNEFFWKMYTSLLDDDEGVSTRRLETDWPGVYIGKGKGKDRAVRALFLANTAAVAVASVYEIQ